MDLKKAAKKPTHTPKDATCTLPGYGGTQVLLAALEEDWAQGWRLKTPLKWGLKFRKRKNKTKIKKLYTIFDLKSNTIR